MDENERSLYSSVREACDYHKIWSKKVKSMLRNEKVIQADMKIKEVSLNMSKSSDVDLKERLMETYKKKRGRLNGLLIV